MKQILGRQVGFSLFSLYCRFFNIDFCQYGFENLSSDYIIIARRKSPLDHHFFNQICNSSAEIFESFSTVATGTPLFFIDSILPRLQLTNSRKLIRETPYKPLNLILLFTEENTQEMLAAAVLLCRFRGLTIMPAAISGSSEVLQFNSVVPHVGTVKALAGIPLSPPFACNGFFRKKELHESVRQLFEQLRNVERVSLTL
ncbi:MAG: hypothetical protein HQM08_24435 [Candidatus Riflebacteria bacterium]|nr:hypothetical protein [Candidatus Riflebacteria bacterium]